MAKTMANTKYLFNRNLKNRNNGIAIGKNGSRKYLIKTSAITDTMSTISNLRLVIYILFSISSRV
ncbi:MAG: hypothetical protein GY705_27745 [Bacteroidetes bacterium]|nr:hypothetical protein [Bacteroidota bacterium]